MPAIKESRAKRLYREKRMKEHYREEHPKKPKPPPPRGPSCRGCPYYIVKQWYKPVKKSGVSGLRYQGYCTNPAAIIHGNSALGPPQMVEAMVDVKLRKRRPKWCPYDKKHKLEDIWPDERVSE